MKKIYLCLFALFVSFFYINNASAASASISASSYSSRVIVGNTVTVTVKVSSSSNLGSWQFDVVPSKNLTFVTSSFGGLYVKDVVSSATQTSKSYTFKFKANSSGTASVAIKNASVIGYDEKNMSVSTKSTSFTTLTQSELEAGYSKNNYLSNLSIEGYELEFDKETLEYELEVENDVESINVVASKDDSRSSVDGTGSIELSEGINALNVVVTAQNGSTRTYVVNVNRKELNPIIVNVDGSEYTVIRKKEFLPSVSMYYVESTVGINEEEVPSYYNEVTGVTLVGLKDSNGESNLYIYDDGYKLYNELSFNQLVIYILDEEVTVPEGYISKNITIGSNDVLAYASEDYDFPLIYGLNIETGEKNLYKYDENENTLQRYEEVVSNVELYMYIIYGLSGLLFISYIIFIISSKKKKVNKIDDEISEKTDILKTMNIDVENVKEESEKEGLTKEEKKKKLTKEEKKLQKQQEKEKKEYEEVLKFKEELELKKKLEEEKKLKKKKKKKKSKDDFSDMAKL